MYKEDRIRVSISKETRDKLEAQAKKQGKTVPLIAQDILAQWVEEDSIPDIKNRVFNIDKRVNSVEEMLKNLNTLCAMYLSQISYFMYLNADTSVDIGEGAQEWKEKLLPLGAYASDMNLLELIKNMNGNVSYKSAYEACRKAKLNPEYFIPTPIIEELKQDHI